MYPMTCATEYFGGIEINMCTWAGIRWPAITWHSFCFAKVLKTSPNLRRSSPYSVFLRYFGMNTTWYLQSHTLWLSPQLQKYVDVLSVDIQVPGRYPLWREGRMPRQSPFRIELGAEDEAMLEALARRDTRPDT